MSSTGAGSPARPLERGEQRAPDEEPLVVELALEGGDASVGGLTGRLGGAEVQELAGVVPFVERLGGVDAVVALEPHERPARPGRHGAGHLGLADPGVALEQQRPAEAEREEDRRGQALVGEVALPGQAGYDVLDAGGVPVFHGRKATWLLASAGMDLGIAGRTAAVAAASAGLGLASARALAADGVRVAICGRDRERLDAAIRSLPGEGHVALVADVSTPDGAAGFVHGAAEALGAPPDILVTNAGGPPPGTFASTPLEAYEPALALNLLSVVAMCQAAVPPMQAQGWGRVVAITSIAVKQPIGTLILSNTARAGATGFLKTLATEVAAQGVTVNSVLPGLHATDRLKQLHGGDVSHLTVGDPADFGTVVAFLCSAQAGFVTGTAIQVDGGAYAGLL